jgi:acetyl-CoA carboxylase biotin carboxyl carrier protein
LALKDIKDLIALMRRNDLTELEIEQEGHRIKLKRGMEPVVTQATNAPGPPPSTPAAEPKVHREIVSPMVGTFYSAATPESASYVEAGSEVTEDTVVCIIEAMKVMNEIKAETRGVIAEILVENGKPVQYGQALFRLK